MASVDVRIHQDEFPRGCLLTGHESGELLLWCPDNLIPLLRINLKQGPIKYYTLINYNLNLTILLDH